MLFGLAAISREFIHNHAQSIHNAKSTAYTEGVLHRDDFIAKARFSLIERGIEVRFFMVCLIDNKNSGSFKTLDVFPDKFGADFYAVFSVEQHDAGVGNFESGNHLADEIIGTGCVNNVNFAIFPIHVHECRKNRAFSILLNLCEIGCRVVVFNFPPSRNRFCFIQHTFYEGGFPRARVPQQDYITDVLCIINHEPQI